jgi:hypothetical protein
MAGDGALLGAIHGHYGDALRYSCMVGATHLGAGSRPADLPGPAPRFFFAPSQIKKRSGEWGAGEFMERIGNAFIEFASYAEGWLNVVTSVGPEAMDRTYAEVLEGRSTPAKGHILVPTMQA